MNPKFPQPPLGSSIRHEADFATGTCGGSSATAVSVTVTGPRAPIGPGLRQTQSLTLSANLVSPYFYEYRDMSATVTRRFSPPNHVIPDSQWNYAWASGPYECSQSFQATTESTRRTCVYGME